jgi:transcriptional regulator with XRE-family HTH domain
MSDYGKRLKEAMRHSGVTQHDLADFAGIKQASVSHCITTGRGSSHTTSFATICGIDALWLETGKGEMVKSKISVTKKETDLIIIFKNLDDAKSDQLLSFAKFLSQEKI